MARSRDISKVLSSNTTLSSTYAPIAAGSLVQITPLSITNTGGSGSISSTGTITFSGVSSLSLNSVFSSSYSHYLINFKINSSSGVVDLQSRLRISGTDNSSANYSRASLEGGGGGAVVYQTNPLTTSWVLCQIDTTNNRHPFSIEVFNPAETGLTTMDVKAHSDLGSTAPYYINRLCATSVSTIYDSITFFPSSGTISGNVSIYGYRK